MTAKRLEITLDSQLSPLNIISIPNAAINAPAVIVSGRLIFLNTVMALKAFESPMPDNTKGTPIPRENTNRSNIPAKTVSCEAATPRTPPRMAPMQGDHPNPNAAPNTTGDRNPKRVPVT